MKKRFISIVITSYFAITLLIFILEVFLKFGQPLLVIGQAFLLGGLLSVRNNTFGYLFVIVGLYIVLSTLNIININMFYFRYIIVVFFPFVPLFILFSEWNDKQRILRKGAIQVEASYIGDNFYGGSQFKYYINDMKFQSTSYKSGEYNYNKNDKVKIYVSTENPEKIFVPLPEKQIKMIKEISLFFSIFSLLLILLMLFENK